MYQCVLVHVYKSRICAGGYARGPCMCCVCRRALCAPARVMACIGELVGVLQCSCMCGWCRESSFLAGNWTKTPVLEPRAAAALLGPANPAWLGGSTCPRNSCIWVGQCLCYRLAGQPWPHPFISLGLFAAQTSVPMGQIPQSPGPGQGEGCWDPSACACPMGGRPCRANTEQEAPRKQASHGGHCIQVIRAPPDFTIQGTSSCRDSVCPPTQWGQ